MRFSPVLRKTVVTAHVVTAVGWLGAEAVILVLAASGVAGADPAVVYPAAGLIGGTLLGPLAVAAWLVGVISSLGTPWGLVRYWWVLVKLATTTVMTGLMLFVMVPGLREAADLAGAFPAAERSALLVAALVATALLILNTALSVFKPFGRVRRGGTPTSAAARTAAPSRRRSPAPAPQAPATAAGAR